MPIVIGSEPSPFGDTPDPKCFGTVSPLDPQMFSTIAEHVADQLGGKTSSKYSPIEVAQWIDDYVAASNNALTDARQKASNPKSPEFRRIEADVQIQMGLGKFYVAKLRSGVLFEIFRQTGNVKACTLALENYQRARQAWASMAVLAATVYVKDVSYGDVPMRRGNWGDKVPAIDKDILALTSKLEEAKLKTAAASGPGTASAETVSQAIAAAIGRPKIVSVQCDHTPPAGFKPGEALELAVQAGHSSSPVTANLYYRHVNQGERWMKTATESAHGGLSGTIPAEYTQSEYPLEYYFEVRAGDGPPSMYPAFNLTLSNQPYFAIMQHKA
jgi:hypothetical protein